MIDTFKYHKKETSGCLNLLKAPQPPAGSHTGVLLSEPFVFPFTEPFEQVFQKLTWLTLTLTSSFLQSALPTPNLLPELGLVFHLCIILVNKIIQLGNPFKVLNSNREKLMELLWIFFFNKLMLVMFCGFLSARLYHQGYYTHNNQSQISILICLYCRKSVPLKQQQMRLIRRKLTGRQIEFDF